MVSASSLRPDVSALLARCGAVVFCTILLVPLSGERGEAPSVGPRLAMAAADEWHLGNERPAPSQLSTQTSPAPVSPLAVAAVPADAAVPVAPVAPGAPVALEPEAPRAAPAPRAVPPPVPLPAAPPPPVATAAPVAALGGGTLVLASWYGPGFYGNRTACGQTYTTQIQGVANLSLPCGTIVTLTYGGRTLSVPVIDRGPYVAGRTLDLSNATRQSLGCPDLCNLLMRVGN